MNRNVLLNVNELWSPTVGRMNAVEDGEREQQREKWWTL